MFPGKFNTISFNWMLETCSRLLFIYIYIFTTIMWNVAQPKSYENNLPTNWQNDALQWK